MTDPLAEGERELAPERWAYRWLITLCVCLGYVMLAAVLTYVLNAYANRGVGPLTGCPPHLDRDHWYLVIPELAAVALVLLTRRRAHQWYGATAVFAATLGIALVAFFWAMVFSTPGICFD